MTPREFFARRKGFYESENYRQEREWERLRWQTIYLLNISGKTVNKNLSFEDFPLPWEKKKILSNTLTKERNKKLRELSDILDSKEVIKTEVLTASELNKIFN